MDLVIKYGNNILDIGKNLTPLSISYKTEIIRQCKNSRKVDGIWMIEPSSYNEEKLKLILNLSNMNKLLAENDIVMSGITTVKLSECYIKFVNDKVYFIFGNISHRHRARFSNYKNWNKTDHSGNTEFIKYFGIRDEGRYFIVSSEIGMASLFSTLARSMGYTILDTNKKLFDFASNYTNVAYPKYDINLYPYQKDAFLSWKKSNIGIIQIPTGGGKTIVAGFAINYMQKKTLILMHDHSLAQQWKKSLVGTMGKSMESRIGLISGEPSINDNIERDIVIATYLTVLNNIDRFQNRFGFVIADECHRVAASTFMKVMEKIDSPIRLGLTATPKRTDGREGDVFAMLDDVKYRVKLRKLIIDEKTGKRYVALPIFNKIELTDNVARSRVSDFKGLEKGRKMIELSSNSFVKQKRFIELTKKIITGGENLVVFADRILIAERLESELLKINVDNKPIRVKYVSSNMKAGERTEIYDMLNNGRLDCIIFASLGGEGIDIPMIQNVVLYNQTKSWIKFMQRVGRGCRRVEGIKEACNIYQFILKDTLEESWFDVAFLEYAQEGFKIINMK